MGAGERSISPEPRSGTRGPDQPNNGYNNNGYGFWGRRPDFMDELASRMRGDDGWDDFFNTNPLRARQGTGGYDSRDNAFRDQFFMDRAVPDFFSRGSIMDDPMRRFDNMMPHAYSSVFPYPHHHQGFHGGMGYTPFGNFMPYPYPYHMHPHPHTHALESHNGHGPFGMRHGHRGMCLPTHPGDRMQRPAEQSCRQMTQETSQGQQKQTQLQQPRQKGRWVSEVMEGLWDGDSEPIMKKTRSSFDTEGGILKRESQRIIGDKVLNVVKSKSIAHPSELTDHITWDTETRSLPKNDPFKAEWKQAKKKLTSGNSTAQHPPANTHKALFNNNQTGGGLPLPPTSPPL